ncbi:hypothetical protein OPT61_g7739 [Boeremia exigua]|uniref:Uncharacterized protein n=1 Tax=Boeremia exigua TaxID=749465 RepID=A0ACC2I140_9PLEO|nr:hypothetical protein OPT61_g7739 [Boeremia exigua]
MVSKTLFNYAALATAASASICPILGPVFPAPSALSSSTAFQDTLKALQSKIDQAFANGNTSYGSVNPYDTYSIQIFSTASEELLFDYHRRGPTVLGNQTVDGDSVYRIASTTKLITVYLLLIAAGPEVLHDKVTKYLPELAGEAYWDDMSVGSLSNYLAGVASELFDTSPLPGGDLAAAFPGALPPLSTNETLECKYDTNGCSREAFLRSLLKRPPVYLPNTTPVYSNAAFATLGLVLEAAANATFGDLLNTLLIAPLHLNGTTVSQPKDLTKAIIPGSAATSGWDIDFKDTPKAATGGLFSTPNDMSAIGRAILSSSLLPSTATRAWLKPTSFGSSLIAGVGHGWEIYRTVVSSEHSRVIDLYTKAGNLPGYGANLILIPDFDVGIVIMMAGQRGTMATPIATVIINDVLPALDEAARVQADAAFAGTYTATNGLNSTIKVTSTPGVPGLSIEEWISNSTDLRSEIIPETERFQMFPTNRISKDGKQVSWRTTSLFLPESGSPFDACASWVAIDRPNYGLYGLDDFIFHLGEDGKASGLEPRALKIVLEKT